MYEEKEKTENFWRRKIFFFAEGILQRQEVFTDLKIEEMESFILQILTVLPQDSKTARYHKRRCNTGVSFARHVRITREITPRLAHIAVSPNHIGRTDMIKRNLRFNFAGSLVSMTRQIKEEHIKDIFAVVRQISRVIAGIA